MAESPASIPLHHIMTEMNGVKSQWESLIDRISQGYGDAYKMHDGALNEVRKKRAEVANANREALSFLFSVVSMGFAGGAVGSLFSAWTKEAADKVAKFAFREGMRGLASEAAKKSTGAAVAKIIGSAGGSTSSDGLDPAAPPPWEYYLEKKTKLDTCFGQVNEHLTALIETANNEQWSEAIGQDILDSWRKFCPLLADAPKSDAPPKREDMARGAEALMWVAWCNQRDWASWDKQYDAITWLLAEEASKKYSVTNSRIADVAHALKNCNDFKPVMHRIMFVIGYGPVINVPDKWESILPSGYYFPLVVDMRVPGKLVQWTHIIQNAMPAAVDVDKMLDKNNIPFLLAAFGQSKKFDSKLFDGMMNLKPFYKRTK